MGQVYPRKSVPAKGVSARQAGLRISSRTCSRRSRSIDNDQANQEQRPSTSLTLQNPSHGLLFCLARERLHILPHRQQIPGHKQTNKKRKRSPNCLKYLSVIMICILVNNQYPCGVRQPFSHN
ncbi:unnamed protein product [Ixodes persulcatus]